MTIRAIVDKWPVADRIKQAFLEWLPEEGFVLDEEPGPGFSQLKLEEMRPPFSLSDAKDILSQLATAQSSRTPGSLESLHGTVNDLCTQIEKLSRRFDKDDKTVSICPSHCSNTRFNDMRRKLPRNKAGNRDRPYHPNLNPEVVSGPSREDEKPNFEGMEGMAMMPLAQEILESMLPENVKIIAVEGIIWMDRISSIEYLSIHGKTDYIIVVEDKFRNFCEEWQKNPEEPLSVEEVVELVNIIIAMYELKVPPLALHPGTKIQSTIEAVALNLGSQTSAQNIHCPKCYFGDVSSSGYAHANFDQNRLEVYKFDTFSKFGNFLRKDLEQARDAVTSNWDRITSPSNLITRRDEDDQPDKKKRRRGNDGDFDSEARENSENGNGDEGNAPDGGRVEGNQTERTLLPEFQNEAMELNRLQILSEVFGSLRSADPVEFESFDPNFTGHMWVPSRNHSSENLSVLG